MERTWSKIDGFYNYSVSNDGLIRNDKRNQVKAQRVNKDGYSVTDIYRDGERFTYRVHRIVANEFLDNPENKEEVNHIDGDKTNNNVDNLEWVTKSENMKHAYDTGLCLHHASYGMLGKKNPNGGRHGIPIMVVETGEVFESIADCAEALGISDRRICDVLKGHSRSYRGYTFTYV